MRSCVACDFPAGFRGARCEYTQGSAVGSEHTQGLEVGSWSRVAGVASFSYPGGSRLQHVCCVLGFSRLSRLTPRFGPPVRWRLHTIQEKAITSCDVAVATGPAPLAVDDRREWAARRVDDTIAFANTFALPEVVSQLGDPIGALGTSQHAVSCKVILQGVCREL